MLDMRDIQRDMERRKDTGDLLAALLEAAGGDAALVFDLDGEPVVEAGQVEGDVSGLTRRLADIWSRADAVARMIGEAEAQEQALLAGNRHLHLTQAGPDHLLAVVFGPDTNLGIVRLYAMPAADRAGALLAEAGGENGGD